jgi:hypothetical protein
MEGRKSNDTTETECEFYDQHTCMCDLQIPNLTRSNSFLIHPLQWMRVGTRLCVYAYWDGGKDPADAVVSVSVSVAVVVVMVVAIVVGMVVMVVHTSTSTSTHKHTRTHTQAYAQARTRTHTCTYNAHKSTRPHTHTQDLAGVFESTFLLHKAGLAMLRTF